MVTARNAPAHERAIRTLREWKIAVNEMHFLGGIEKSGVLQVFNPHIFFDDTRENISSCAEKLPAAQVMYSPIPPKKPATGATTTVTTAELPGASQTKATS